MNKDKWNQVFLDEINKYQNHSISAMVTPENWSEEKKKLLKFVENVDKLTEVYNMENKG